MASSTHAGTPGLTETGSLTAEPASQGAELPTGSRIPTPATLGTQNDASLVFGIDVANSSIGGEVFPATDWPGIGGADDDDSFGDQLACPSANTKRSPEHQRCLNPKLEENLADPTYLSTKPIDDSEIVAVQLACEPLRGENPEVYDRCVEIQLNPGSEFAEGALPRARADPTMLVESSRNRRRAHQHSSQRQIDRRPGKPHRSGRRHGT